MNAGGAPSGGSGESLPREARITTADEIRALFRRGKRRRTRHLDVFVSASPVSYPRLALVVAKPRAGPGRGTNRRIRGSAVRRNQLKRRLREIARRDLLPRLRARGTAVDVLVRTRPEAYGASFDELRRELATLEDWLCSQES